MFQLKNNFYGFKNIHNICLRAFFYLLFLVILKDNYINMMNDKKYNITHKIYI